MHRDLTKANCRNAGRKRRFGDNRQSKYCKRSESEIFLNGGGRFKPAIECRIRKATVRKDIVVDRKIRKKKIERRSGVQRRSESERRCGTDMRSDVEQFLQGERRSGVDRRSGIERRYRSFKKARAFARDLGLISIDEWRAFCKSGMRPNNIPAAPHYIYANDGWLGWGDWFGASTVAMYLSHFHFFRKARVLVYGHRFGSNANSAVARLLKINENFRRSTSAVSN